MATQEAVERRREFRRLRSSEKSERRKQREFRNAQWSERMIRRRFIPPDEVRLLHLDFRYWLARRCGWDALSKELACDEQRRSCDPAQSVFWLWWTGLHAATRIMLAKTNSVHVGCYR
jgi:hypothetical protein